MTIKDSLYQFMGHSSLNYLAQQMNVVYSSTQILLDFFGEVLHENWPLAHELRNQIKEFTQQARDMQKIADEQLTKDRFAPVKRSEVIGLLQLQTQIANKSQSITGLVIGRAIVLPSSVAVEYFPLLNKSIAAIYQTYNLVNHLDDLALIQSKSVFIEHLQQMIIELDQLENETDQLQIRARNALLAIEHELYPVDVISLYKMLEWTGDLADKAHELGGKLVSLLAQ
jgi:predicted phosphate transport protein (TIGR00153 family)